MKKKYRLLREADFKFLITCKKKVFTTYFVCYYSFEDSTNNIKIGIIIPKKKCRLATDRNYLKRLFWSLNTKEELLRLPSVKCLFFYNSFFYKSFLEKNLDFKKMKSNFNETIYKIKNSSSNNI